MLILIKFMRRKFLIPSLWALMSGISLPGMLQRGALALDNEGTGQQTGMPIHFQNREGRFYHLGGGRQRW